MREIQRYLIVYKVVFIRYYKVCLFIKISLENIIAKMKNTFCLDDFEKT